MQFEDDEFYFKCPNCPTTYNFTQFHELEHMSQASPSDGPDVLGQAKCHNCAKEFYYYLTSDAIPMVIENDPPRQVALSAFNQTDTVELSGESPVSAVASEFKGNDPDDLEENQQDRVVAF